MLEARVTFHSSLSLSFHVLIERSVDPPKVYVLRSTLPPHLVQALVTDRLDALVVGAPEDPSKVSIMQELEEWKEEDGVMRDYKREEGGSYGLLGVILGLILVNSKVLGDGQ